MKTLLPFVLVVLLLAACSSFPQVSGTGTASSASTLSAETPSAPPPGADQATLPGYLPQAMTVQPPRVPIEPIQGTQLPPGVTPPPALLQGWQTFSSTSLGVTVAYPPNWSASERAEGVTFTSPEGMTVQLQLVSAGSEQGPSTASQACNLLVNANGVSVEVCGGGATPFYQANFHVLKTDGSVETLQLSTSDPRALDVYRAMLNSLQPE